MVLCGFQWLLMVAGSLNKERSNHPKKNKSGLYRSFRWPGLLMAKARCLRYSLYDC